MAAHLPPGGRMVNYDPQTYSSYPGQPPGGARPQHHPGAALGVRLRVHRQRELRVDHAHPRTGRSRHRPAVVGDARSARPPRGRDRARVLPRAARNRCPAPSTTSPDPRELRRRPRPAPGVRCQLQRHRVPLLPRAQVVAALAGRPPRGSSASLSNPSAATLVLAHAADPGTLVRFGTLSADGSTRWGGVVPVAAGATTGDGAAPATEPRSDCRCRWSESLPAQRVVITVAGHPYELGGCALVGARARTVAAGRLLPGVRGVHPPQASRAASRPPPPAVGGCPCR